MTCNLGPCSACRDAETIDQQIELLFERRRQLWSIRNSFHDRFILQLPLELASRIFICCVPSEDEQVARPNQHRTQLLLTWVCKSEFTAGV